VPLRFARPLLFALLGLVGCSPQPEGQASSVPPTLVNTAVPIERSVQDYEDYTGRVAAQYSVEVRSRVTGYLDKIEFQDGAEVKEGDLLFVIDRRPFQAASDSAKALVAVKKAASAFRDAEFKRNQELISKNAVSKSEFDQSAAAFEEAKAMVASAEAEAEMAKLNLDFTEIYARISGVVSNRKLDLGNLVVADQTLLTSIVSVDPMYVYFDVDERRLLRIQQEVRDGRIKLAEDGRIPVEVGLDDETGFPHPGTINFIDNRLDAQTGTIRLRALVPNPKPEVGKRKMLADMNARVRVPLGEPRPSVLIAEAAVGSDQGRKYVYVVDAAKTVQQRWVRLGRSERGLVVVEEGLKPGETVIVAGVQRVRPGVVVTTNGVEMQSLAATPLPSAGAKAPANGSPAAPQPPAAPSAVPSATPAPSPTSSATPSTAN
jgi:multidrug efflux system membrane fusion protein